MTEEQWRAEFLVELRELVNRRGLDSELKTPDFVVADYILGCIDAFADATRARTKWDTVPVPDEVASAG